MKKKTRLFGKRRHRGQRVSTGKGWRLVKENVKTKKELVFKASVIKTFWVVQNQFVLCHILRS
jgi:hypothetical protein